MRPEVAYQEGWDTAGQPSSDLPAEEAKFLAANGDGWWSWWLDGWMDRIRGKEYLHRMNCFEPCKSCRDDKYAGEEWY